MFNYIHESIINNADNIVKTDGDKRVCIKRVGEYVVENIVEKTMMKTEGNPGEPGWASFDVPKVEGNLLRITMFISTPKDAFAEFAMPF